MTKFEGTPGRTFEVTCNSLIRMIGVRNKNERRWDWDAENCQTEIHKLQNVRKTVGRKTTKFNLSVIKKEVMVNKIQH